VGEPAANLRALIAGSYSVKDEKAANELMKQLDGTFEPEKVSERGVTKEQMKIQFGI